MMKLEVTRKPWPAIAQNPPPNQCARHFDFLRVSITALSSRDSPSSRVDKITLSPSGKHSHRVALEREPLYELQFFAKASIENQGGSGSRARAREVLRAPKT